MVTSHERQIFAICVKVGADQIILYSPRGHHLFLLDSG